MTETLAQIRQTVDARLRELEPYVEEYRQLREVASSLSSGSGGRPAGRRSRRDANGPLARPPAAVKTTSSGRRSSGKGGSGRRAPRGQNREAILRLIGARPGISNREIADESGIDRRVVATAISKYKRDGLLQAEGKGVKLADGPAD